MQQPPPPLSIHIYENQSDMIIDEEEEIENADADVDEDADSNIDQFEISMHGCVDQQILENCLICKNCPYIPFYINIQDTINSRNVYESLFEKFRFVITVEQIEELINELMQVWPPIARFSYGIDFTEYDVNQDNPLICMFNTFKLHNPNITITGYISFLILNRRDQLLQSQV